MVFDGTWRLTDAKNPLEDELARLFAAAKKDGPRSHLLIVLAYNGALRVSELIHLKVSDFNFQTGKVKILPLKKAGKKRFRGPDGRVRMVDKPLPAPIECPFPDIALQLTRKYLALAKPSDWLFPGASASCRIVKFQCPGGHMSKRAVQKIFDRLAIAAGVKVPSRGIHSLKHGRLTEIARKSKDPFLVKAVGRHASISMADHYVKYVDYQERLNEIGGQA